jgi:hypothetical protein
LWHDLEALKWSVFLWIVNLSTRLKNKKPNQAAGKSYCGERNQNCFHDHTLQAVI